MADVFGLPIEKIDIYSSQDNIDEWDSVNHLNLITSLEENFEISVPMEDIGNMTNFQIVSAVVKEQIVNK